MNYIRLYYGALSETRTRTSYGHYPLKIACLPIPPSEQSYILLWDVVILCFNFRWLCTILFYIT